MQAAQMKTVAVIDFGLGNLFSVQQACVQVGLNPTITSDPEALPGFDGVILPGVGAFPRAMANLRKLRLDRAILAFIATGKPFMGICLGFQMLFEGSEEFETVSGLGLLPGFVRKFPSRDESGAKLLVPQVGWNTVHYTDACLKASVYKAIPDGSFFYFVHSFYVSSTNPALPTTLTEYGGLKYCSSVLTNNIFACQFHPEKSGLDGLQIYRNWGHKVCIGLEV